MKNLKQISALFLIIIFSSCNEESLIEGRLPVEVVDNGQQNSNVNFTVNGVSYVGNPLTIENQTSSACSNFIVVASSYNNGNTKGIQIVNYRQTSTTIFDFFSNPCTQMRVTLQIDGTNYFSKTGIYSVSGNIFTLSCSAVAQVQGGQIGTTIYSITATGKIM